MDILIKNMDVISSCSDCPLNYDMMSCIITGTRWWSDRIMLMDFDCDNERLYDCPLIEVPTPHGRLIDADELMTKISTMMQEPDYQHDGEDWMIGLIMARDAIDNAPTVIKENK